MATIESRLLMILFVGVGFGFLLKFAGKCPASVPQNSLFFLRLRILAFRNNFHQAMVNVVIFFTHLNRVQNICLGKLL